MNAVCESLDCQHVPSTPSCPRPDPSDARVPDVHWGNSPDISYKSELLVPSTPTSPSGRRVYYTQRGGGLGADSRCTYLHVSRVQGCRQVPDIELFTSFAEQVVPYTPRGQAPATPGEPRRVTNKTSPTYKRAKVAKSRLAGTPLLPCSTCHVNKERQFSLFSGDEIFA
ncbi:uncharacterized protein LOC124125976 [Haliotis rufescens]|uniref:uncharacterized protein LOC124125976 n=1 Tax=Haliotis rufescens TaxID=6454 RepID=UPI00201F8449|nr:uncharacterized protein LOC124125976 [Haliotis rufescens]